MLNREFQGVGPRDNQIAVNLHFIVLLIELNQLIQGTGLSSTAMPLPDAILTAPAIRST